MSGLGVLRYDERTYPITSIELVAGCFRVCVVHRATERFTFNRGADRQLFGHDGVLIVSCPAHPKIDSFEVWPGDILTIVDSFEAAGKRSLEDPTHPLHMHLAHRERRKP